MTAPVLDLIDDLLLRATATPSTHAMGRLVQAVRDLAAADGATLVLRDEGQCFYVDEDAIEPLWGGQRFPSRRASADGRCSTASR